MLQTTDLFERVVLSHQQESSLQRTPFWAVKVILSPFYAQKVTGNTNNQPK